ncbi:hypothetical protein [Actinoplanes regularis]|uniref:Rv3660c-like CheY-like N-terminal domain-containing protein n=1 Tax=Actinoplanes regularis TaxID=52697 RepID=A0A238XIW4_9ACTN|nr:hypothetical protein [Actinoplanes regularis]GIE90507.1 hypothetical protein Are01nite_69870 [Actinoplanes regularis]SNR58867.1 hypothetical protein SAMN06264365_103499 [Actinoplanes regularis]
MTGILAITSDPQLRDAWSDAASRAGAHLTQHPDILAAHALWPQATLVLLGADQVSAAVRARLPVRAGVIVVAADTPDSDVYRAADLLRAAYVAMVPICQDWLVDQLRPAGDRVLDRLRATRFSVGYTHRDRAADTGWVRPVDWRERPDEDRPHAYVMLSDVARGECRSGQSSLVHRSNMRSLHRAFPGVFTDMVFANVTALGAFAADLPVQVVDVLCRLSREYLVFDEDDLAVLEREEILASWQRWLADDVRPHLGKHARAVWDLLSDDDRERLWWDTVIGRDAWPEHDMRTVLWGWSALIDPYTARLTAEGRRRAKTNRNSVSVVG